MATTSNRRLYIGNLLYQVQPEEIFDLLEAQDITSLNLDMSIDPFSGWNPSYCFVDLDDSEDAEAVIDRLQSCSVRGRPVKVHYDVGKRAGRPTRVETRMKNGDWRSFDFSLGPNSAPVFNKFAWTEARDHWTKPVEEGRRLYVGGLSDICNQAFVNEEMRLLFGSHNILAVSKRVLPTHRNTTIPATGQCYCFVDFSSAKEAENAMAALDGMPTPYGGSYKINLAYAQQDRKVCREQAKLLGIRRVTGEVKRDLGGNWRSRT